MTYLQNRKYTNFGNNNVGGPYINQKKEKLPLKTMPDSYRCYVALEVDFSVMLNKSLFTNGIQWLAEEVFLWLRIA